MYEKRFYRDGHINEGLLKFNVVVNESDILIIMDPVDDLNRLKKKIHGIIVNIRKCILDYSEQVPDFLTSLKPLEDSAINQVQGTKLIDLMHKCGKVVNVGPMAAVAGLTAQLVVESLVADYGNINIIAENGGDIYMNTLQNRQIAIYAGASPLSNQLALDIKSGESPISICTSSATIGHSLSFGKADAVVVLSADAGLADAVATALCNQVQSKEDIGKVLDRGISIEGIKGILIIIGSQIGFIGDISLVRLV